MQIEIKGRNLQVTDEMREHAARRFDKIGKQVSERAVLELEVADENVPGDPVAAEAVLHLKGTQLRAKEVSKDAKHAINLVADNLERQVKRHREKRRGRRADLDQDVASDRDPGGVAAGQRLQADVAERLDQQGGGGLGVHRGIAEVDGASEAQLVTHDDIARIRDRMANHGDFLAAWLRRDGHGETHSRYFGQWVPALEATIHKS
jgi:putative sigma-54 modulation protein